MSLGLIKTVFIIPGDLVDGVLHVVGERSSRPRPSYPRQASCVPRKLALAGRGYALPRLPPLTMQALAARVNCAQRVMAEILHGLEGQGFAEPNTGGTWSLTAVGQPFGIAAVDGLRLLGDVEEQPRHRSGGD